MERHAYTLYTSLASRGHEVHVFTVSSDRSNLENQEEYYNKGDLLHIYFPPKENGVLNYSHAFEIFQRINVLDRPFDYVHTESVALPHWRIKMVPKGDVAVTWHGIWYEIMHSKLFQELYDSNDHPSSDLDLTMPRLIDEIRFFPAYKQHICISNSAREVLVNIYQLPKRNVHVIVNGVDQTNSFIVMGVSGRLVRDKGHPLLYEAFALIAKTHPQVYLLVAGSGPWGKRYAELGQNVRVLGSLEPDELSGFYNALDVFVNPTMRPQGLDLTIIEAMQCGNLLWRRTTLALLGRCCG
ncbi:UDP-Glycosyltransferase superfamily protein [Raphanus sativus]|nr:UDP-Glycosyltransferase superfamily protein [Raphanus sativus]